MKRVRTAAAAAIWVLTAGMFPSGGWATQASDPPRPVSTAPSAAKTPPRPFSEFRIVPVRVHLLRDSETAAAVTRLTEKDIARIFKKANGIWHAAGIHLWVESIVTEKPASTTGYEHAASLPVAALKALRPPGSHPLRMFHVYYIGEMPPNGIFMGTDAIFVKESARLRPVEGGIDEPLPRVTAHELGHGMGLPHRQDTFNLLASGTTGTSLNDAEIDTVRSKTLAMAWVETVEQFLRDAAKAQADNRPDVARSMYQALTEIPGDSTLKKQAAEHLATL